MSPSHPAAPLAAQRLRDQRRQTLAFSLLGLVLVVVAVATLEPPGFAEHRIAALDLLARVESGGRRFDFGHAPALVGVGVIAGTLAGMLGMGGGVLKVAGMLVVFQLDILLARAVSLTTMFLATGSAALVHLRKQVVLRPIVVPMLIPGIFAVFAGMFVGNVLPRSTLTHFFAFFALFLAFNTLAQTVVDPREYHLRHQAPRTMTAARNAAAAGIGGFHGFVCGLIGISGGVIALPLQQVVLRVPARNAVANSVVVSAVITGIGSVGATSLGVARGDFHFLDVVFATVCIGGGAVLGGQVGARLTSAVPLTLLRMMFLAVTLAAGLMILFK